MGYFLICYVIVSNLTGFLLMGIDKSRARRHKYRIPEKTLFMAAILGGSIGALVGMHVFHHKTRHLKFLFGIPLILLAQLILIGCILSMNRREMESPSQAVEYELELIQELDADTIHSFVSYENLTNSQIAPGEAGPETAEAVQRFFRDFRYSILNETITGNEAQVNVNITNIDTAMLARDLRTEILKQSASIYPTSTDPPTANDYYRLLLDMLNGNSYGLVTTLASFHLVRDESGWTILADDVLEDQLVSGFITNLNDPFLLSADTVLRAYLDAFGALDGAQWKEFLKINDVFATYNTDYSSLIDSEYMEQISRCFDYEILRCQENGSTALADVRITSLDLRNVLDIYRNSLLGYASTLQSVKDDAIAASNEMSRLLLEALQENRKTASTDITMELTNDGSTWNVLFDENFTNSLMGDVEGAINNFAALAAEAQSRP